MKKCLKCKKLKNNSEFWTREDNFSLYAWCIFCCNQQVRTPGYPDESERGAGVIRPNYKSLEPDYQLEN